MKNEIDSKFVLAVFDKIRQHGERQEDKHFLEGVYASSDFDGYTVYLNDALVSMSFGFHNQYHFDYESQDHFEQFTKKLQNIHQGY